MRSSLSPSLRLTSTAHRARTGVMFGFARQSTLNRLEERLAKLESDHKQAALDFDELYAKCRKLLGRVVKERATIEAAQETPEAAPSNGVSSSPGRGPLLTPHQIEVQQQILRRRAGAQ